MVDKSKKTIKATVNGAKHTVSIPPDRLLLDMLREDLGLTGTKRGCGNGKCGACSIIMDGKLVDSCLVPAMKADGSEILTVEGLAGEGDLHPIQEAFLEKGAVQCGFCTPGMLLAAKSLLDQNPRPSIEEIKTTISGNLCRCTGYTKIIEAIESVGKDNETGQRT
jgi:carbon-monoxide dehydrogenase small subunit